MLIDEKLEIEDREELIPVVSTFAEEETIETEMLSIVHKEDEVLNKDILLKKIDSDFLKTRDVIHESIDINLSALSLVYESLQNTPHNARLAEVLSKLLDSIKNLNQQYLNSSKQYIDIFKGMLDIENNGKDSQQNKGNIHINNAIFTGTLKELMNEISNNTPIPVQNLQ